MNDHGSILVFTLAVMVLLVSLAGGFLYAASVFISNSGWEEMDAKVFCLAEAGLQKGIWNLKTPSGSSGQGESWTTAGTTENLGDGSYTMVVARWDFALAANSATASASSAGVGQAASSAIDGSDTTYWESANNVTNSNAEESIIAFPYTLTINKARFLVPSGSSVNIPQNYTWQVSTNGTTYTTVVTVTNNSTADVTNTFTAASSVNYLKLNVTRTNTNNRKVRVATLEAIGSKITSTGTVTVSGTTYTRTVSQTVVADDASPQNQVAYYEPDWIEQ